jgi:mRNA (guanine-N7-)-methyltransferase
MSVANHYNTQRGRKNDFMLPVRNFHNFVKARLIASVCTDDTFRFLDFCCGNGGDIGKLKFHGIKEYFGLDIANEAVNRAVQRLQEQSHVTGDAICLNAFSLTCGNMLDRMRAFDIVSCQFALHYAFCDERTARTCIQNVSMALLKGGHFLGTIPDSEYLLNARKQLGKRFGDRYHQVKFANKEYNDPFGDAYEFTFTGAVEALTEYVINKQTLIDLCKECDMELVEWRNFSTYNDTDRTEHTSLFNRMGAEFFPASKIYTTFCFKKNED